MAEQDYDIIQAILNELPAGAQPLVREMYGRLDKEQRAAAQGFLENATRYLGLPETKRLLEIIREQYAPAFAGPRRVCIVGPVNSGKSSLYNALLTTKDNRAVTSPVPGTTKEAQEGIAGILTIIDTPGADDVEIGLEGDEAGAHRREVALNAARQADLLLLVFDASVGITRSALEIYQELTSLGKPYVVALNKMDLVKREQNQVIELAARTLGLDAGQIIPTSATRGTNLERLVIALARANPELLATLGVALPAFRDRLATEQIRNAVIAAGTVNLATSPIPVPFASFVPLTAIQGGLVLSLGRLYGYPINVARARELVTTFGAGFGARTLFQQLVTKVPGPGWVLGTAIAAATTAAIGFAAQAWFGRGERISQEALRHVIDEITRRTVRSFKRFGKKQPDKQRAGEAIVRSVDGLLPSVHPSQTMEALDDPTIHDSE